MPILAIVKPAASLIGSFCAGSVVTTAVKAITPIEATLLKRASMSIGGFVIAGMVSKSASSYINDEIDQAFEMLEVFVQNAEKEEN